MTGLPPLPDPIPEGFDAADLIEAGWTADDIRALLRERCVDISDGWPDDPGAPAPPADPINDPYTAAERDGPQPQPEPTSEKKTEEAELLTVETPPHSILSNPNDDAAIARHNIGAVLRKGANGHIQKNLLTGMIDVTGRCAWDLPGPAIYPRTLADTDVIRAVQWLNRQQHLTTKADAFDHVEVIAAESAYDPILDEWADLAWDGTPRLDTWLSTWGGCDDTPWNRIVAAKLVLSMVARQFEPGCQVDTVTVFEGEQGLRKSTLARTLAGPRFFTDQVETLGGKDTSLQIAGILIAEIAEMAAHRRAQVDEQKRFITRRVEHYRPPYGRMPITQPRRCIFIGTTNELGGYLVDSANRRYWPVRVCRRIDIEGLALARDQLIAEAIARYHSGEPWWLDAAEERLAAAQTRPRESEDPWATAISHWLDGLSDQATGRIFETRTLEISTKALGLQSREINRASAIRIGHIMTALGWERRIHGKARTVLYTRPADDEGPPPRQDDDPNNDVEFL